MTDSYLIKWRPRLHQWTENEVFWRQMSKTKRCQSFPMHVELTKLQENNCALLKSHTKGLEISLLRQGPFSLCSPPCTAFTTWLNTYIFQEAVLDLILAAVAILLPFSPWKKACPLWKLSAEMHGLSLKPALLCDPAWVSFPLWASEIGPDDPSSPLGVRCAIKHCFGTEGSPHWGCVTELAKWKCLFTSFHSPSPSSSVPYTVDSW